ncbi:MAG: DUF2341 domain-containing protein, partial [Thermoplasmatota archaeon]
MSRGDARWRISFVAIIATAILVSAPLSASGREGVGDHSGCAAEETREGVGREYTPWWNSSWLYRRPVTITVSGGGPALAGYQIPLNVSYDAHMEPDFSDLRFVHYSASSGQSVELPYFIVERIDGSRALVWVRVDEIPSGPATIAHMYYGNPSAPSASRASEVFEFFDDFESGALDQSRWEVIDGTWSVVSDGGSWALKATGAGGSSWARKSARLKLPNDATIKNFAVDMDWRVSDDSTLANFIYRAQSTSIASADRWWVRIEARSSYGRGFHLLKSVSGSESWEMVVSINTVTSYNHYTVKVFETTHRLEVRNVGNGERNYAQVSQAGYMGLQVELNSMWIDNICIRKYVNPEPSASIGPEELQIVLKSFYFFPELISEGDLLGFTATFSNPAGAPLQLPISIREGQSFESATELFSEDVTLNTTG